MCVQRAVPGASTRGDWICLSGTATSAPFQTRSERNASLPAPYRASTVVCCRGGGRRPWRRIRYVVLSLVVVVVVVFLGGGSCCCRLLSSLMSLSFLIIPVCRSCHCCRYCRYCRFFLFFLKLQTTQPCIGLQKSKRLILSHPVTSSGLVCRHDGIHTCYRARRSW